MMGSYTYKVNVDEEFCTLPSNITHSAVPGDEEDSSTYMAVLGLSFFHIERSIHILGTIELYVIQLTIHPSIYPISLTTYGLTHWNVV